MNKWDWTLREWRDYYEKLKQRNEQNYQESGESRYDREAHKYDVIVEAMNKALAYDDERDAERMRRIHNINAYVDRLSENHMEIYTLLRFGHMELFTQEMQEEYLKWCQTEDGKKYLKGGEHYKNNEELI